MNLRQLLNPHAPRPAGPAVDLSTATRAELIAKVERLTAELHDMQVCVDEVLDRQAMYANTAAMECLTTAAWMDRLTTPRAHRQAATALTEATMPGRMAGVSA